MPSFLLYAFLAATPLQSPLVQDDGSPQPGQRVGGSFGPSGLGPGCTSTFLTTRYDSDNGAGGNMFDITPNVDLTIECLDVHVSSPTGSAVTVSLWYKLDTCVGFDMDQNAWTLIGTATGSSRGLDNPTPVSFAGNGVVFEAGQEYGIYVEISSGSSRYTNGGPTDFVNADLTLTTYYGKSGWPNTFTYREWNGTLYYEPAGANLILGDFAAGGLATFTIEQLSPGDQAYFALSIQGFGTTPSTFGDLDLASPLVVIPPLPLVANAAGQASLSITMPPGAFGLTVYVQGIGVDPLDGVTLTDPGSGLVQ